MKFSIVLPRSQWWQCLDDIACCLTDALRKAGHEATIFPEFDSGIDQWRTGDSGRTEQCFQVVIGAHRESVILPTYTIIIYQTEVSGSGSFPASYAEKLKRALCVWDSAPGYGTGDAVVEPGLFLQRVRPITQDIGILFYGSLTDRRIELLTKLHDAGLGLECHFNVFGEERNVLIDRAKVIVDIKQREDDPSDKTRTFFLDSRGACVLTENDTNSGRRLSPARIVEQCRTLLADAEMREVHAASRRGELKPTDVSAGIKALEDKLSLRRVLKEVASEFDRHVEQRGNGAAHHPA